MATPAPETSIDSSDNTSQANETISNSVNNSISSLNLSTSTSTDASLEKLENTGNINNGSNLRYEIIPQNNKESPDKLPLKKTANNEKDSEHMDKRMKLEDGNSKQISFDNKPECTKQESNKNESKGNNNNTQSNNDNNNSLKRKADEMDNNNNISSNIKESLTPIEQNMSNLKRDYKPNESITSSNKLNENIPSSKDKNINVTNDKTEPLEKEKVEISNTQIKNIPGNLTSEPLSKTINEEVKLMHKPVKRGSLFDDQGYIVFNQSYISPSSTKHVTLKDVDFKELSDNTMDVDYKFDAEQSNNDSTYGLKSYNSVELSTDASYKKIVESIEDSNVSTISEASSFDNDDSVDISSSVASSNVKRIIERLENNTINNENLTSSTDDNNDGKKEKEKENI